MPHHEAVICVRYRPVVNLLCRSVSSCVSSLGSFDRHLWFTLIRGARRFSPFITRRQSRAGDYIVEGAGEGEKKYPEKTTYCQPDASNVSDSYNVWSQQSVALTRCNPSYLHPSSLSESPSLSFVNIGGRAGPMSLSDDMFVTYLLSRVVSPFSNQSAKTGPDAGGTSKGEIWPLTQEVNAPVPSVKLAEESQGINRKSATGLQ